MRFRFFGARYETSPTVAVLARNLRLKLGTGRRSGTLGESANSWAASERNSQSLLSANARAVPRHSGGSSTQVPSTSRCSQIILREAADKAAALSGEKPSATQ